MPATTPRLSKLSRHAGWVANAGISLLLAAAGWFALQWREVLVPRVGGEEVDWQEEGMDWPQRLSFDLPFFFRQNLPGSVRHLITPARSTREVVLVYMDEESIRRLEQSPTRPWSRARHTQLLDRLTADGARAVMFDVVFDSKSDDDADFAKAIARHGQVFLGATFTVNPNTSLTPDAARRFREPGFDAEKPIRPTPVLAKAARGWGLLIFRPVDTDYGVRRLYPGKDRPELDPWPSISWQMATALGAALPAEGPERFSRRWINYVGPAGTIPQVSYHHVLDPESGLEPGYFKDKIVIVGGKSQLGLSAQKRLDEFSTPFSRFESHSYTPGAEIHATALLNLLHDDWLRRAPVAAECTFVIILGLVLGALRWLRPWRALVVTVGAMAAIAGTALLLQWQAHFWWNWTVPVFLQLPAAAVLAITSRYYLEERRRRKLKQAFGLYLSPELATEIADRDFSLAPGGEKVIATILFTDLEGFTTLSEKLGDSARLGQVLTEYFTRTTDQILAENGTVIKFIGDAVNAAWGAPLPQPDHAERAVRAAWRLSQVAQLAVEVTLPDGRKEIVHARTRVGIHTGEALAGNLGSTRRFDYAIIGDTTNFASRLEGANKYTGTSILLSDDTAQRLGGKFLLRRIGAFRVKGKNQPVTVHELLGEDPTARPAWLDTFAAALQAWEKGDLASARAGFEATAAARGGTDGPSRFYLDHLETATVTPDWTGAVTFGDK